MFCGTTIFWISGFTALPGVIDRLSHQALDAVYWVPQIVGSCGFVVSGYVYSPSRATPVSIPFSTLRIPESTLYITLALQESMVKGQRSNQPAYSLLYMLETQLDWYTPSAHALGWHVGAWNAMGGLGFVVSH